jgi:hypothetical protein
MRRPYRLVAIAAIAAAVRALMATQTEWTGTASDLLGALGGMAGERIVKSKTWPDGPRALAGRLRRAATFLRKIGIEIGFDREGRARTRVIHITGTTVPVAPAAAAAGPSVPSAASASMSKSNPANGFATTPLRAVAEDVRGPSIDGTFCAAQGCRMDKIFTGYPLFQDRPSFENFSDGNISIPLLGSAGHCA